MTPGLLYWTGAFANMLVIVILAGVGVRERRRGRIRQHRRDMLIAAGLVGGFLVSYVLKLALLGREDMSGWSGNAVWTLRFHELCVLSMLLAGGLAARRGSALGRTRAASLDLADPPPAPGAALAHRRAGWTAVVAAALGLLSAALVLVGMYQRAGLL